MLTDDLKVGMHSSIGGVEYQIVSTFGWSLWSPTPAPGFTKRPGKHGFFRSIGPGEQLPCFRITHRGTYRGVSIEVSPSTDGRVLASTSDPDAHRAGFTQHGRAEWLQLIERSDPDLRAETTRTPVPAPWLA